MYKLSYEKCICFIFLVVLAFISCSGFRIDRLATMSDVRETNSYTSTSLVSNSNDFLSRLLKSSQFSDNIRNRRITPDTGPTNVRRVQRRIRHHRRPQTPHFETPNGRAITQPGPTETERHRNPKISISRPQRSPDRRSKKNRPSNCQEQDVARKAYLANTVVLAKAESMSSNRVLNYSVTFRITTLFKSPFPLDDSLRLTFINETKQMNCENARKTHGLVKAQIEQSKEYFLFLNSVGRHNYSVVGMPVLRKKKKKKDLDDIKKVTGKNFAPKFSKPLLQNRSPEAKSRKLKLVCRIRGFPIPYISWRKDGQLLHQTSRMRITYKNEQTTDRKKTTLLIKDLKGDDNGRYECQARGMDNNTATADLVFRMPDSEQDDGNLECREGLRDDFCQNGGTCFYTQDLSEHSCKCADGFTGIRCERKELSNQSSMYGEFSCKLGLSTKYYCL